MTLSAPVHPDKTELRRRSLAARRSLGDQARREGSLRVRATLETWAPFAEAEIVCTYVSYRDEVETLGLIRDLLARGRRVAVPAHFLGTGGPMCFAEVRDWSELSPNRFGILQPAREGARVLPTDSIPLFLVPGLAFDRAGRRLGYGLGFYDRALAGADAEAVKVGLAFTIQILDHVPTVAHDVPMDLVATEGRMITAAPRTGAPQGGAHPWTT